jgi:hypothetical protein
MDCTSRSVLDVRNHRFILSQLTWLGLGREIEKSLLISQQADQVMGYAMKIAAILNSFVIA